MSRSSPGVRRIVSILNFFTDHPGQAFTLTDIVRALKLSRATCHGLLAGLVDAGYLYRASDKSYLLGPAVVAIGQVAKDHYSPLQAAQPEMRALADEFDVSCFASFRENSDVVVRERAASRSNLGNSVPRGARLPLLPELAGAFFIYAPPAAVTEWLDDIEPKATKRMRDGLEASITFVREHGFNVAVFNPGSRHTDGSHSWFEGRDRDDPPMIPLDMLDPDTRYPLVSLTAPILNGGETAFALSLQNFQGLLSGTEIARIGTRLRAACDRVTAFIAGPARS